MRPHRVITTSTEDKSAYLPFGFRKASPAVIVGHGRTAASGGFFPDYWPDYNLERIAAAGFVVCQPSAGGGKNWGNDTSITRVGLAKTYAQSTLGANSGDVFLLGGSMGFVTLCNWARQNVADVRCIVGQAAATDTSFFHPTEPYTTELNTAYGDSATYTSQRPTHNPVQYAAELASIPVKLWHSPVDELVPYAQATAFQAAHGNTTIVDMPGLDHASSFAPAAGMLDFLLANY